MIMFWQAPAYLPYVQPDITSDAIVAAEAALGVTLPKAYLDLLREQNGGYTRLTLPNSCQSQLWGIGPHYPDIVTGRGWVDIDESEQPRDGHLLVPFDGDGHWYLCLDYRDTGPNGEPRVAHIDVECECEEFVATDFSAFLGLLSCEYSSPTWGIVGASMDEVAAALGRVLNVEFGETVEFSEPSDYDFGYPIRRCNLTPEKVSDWVWISPNRVPRGFVRQDDPRYLELVGRLPGYTQRMPMNPDVETILECTEALKEYVDAACKRARLPTIPIHGLRAD
ncbi:MAG TPA: hypothetical protein DHW63_03825 [Hyphomonadaceae bacterium]|nr:hypothetical protein [Hyphomonadaceae bacterium]